MNIVMFIMVIIVKNVFSAMMHGFEMTKSMLRMQVMSCAVIEAMMRVLMTKGMI